MKIYAARPINAFKKYNPRLSDAVMAFITHCWPNALIEDPGLPHHQEGYDKWMQQELAQTRDVHNRMDYFYKVVLPDLDACVAMPFLDGRPGLGVAGEAKKFLLWGRPVWLMEPKKDTTPEDYEAFLANPMSGLFRARPLNVRESGLIIEEVSDDPQKINNPDAEFVVQHLETRLRTWVIYNEAIRPYETSHCVAMPPDGKMPEGFYPQDKEIYLGKK